MSDKPEPMYGIWTPITVQSTSIGDPPTDRGPIIAIPKDDVDALRTRIRRLEAALRVMGVDPDTLAGEGE